MKFKKGDKVKVKQLDERHKLHPVWKTIGQPGVIFDINPKDSNPYHVMYFGEIFCFNDKELTSFTKLDKILS